MDEVSFVVSSLYIRNADCSNDKFVFFAPMSYCYAVDGARWDSFCGDGIASAISIVHSYKFITTYLKYIPFPPIHHLTNNCGDFFMWLCYVSHSKCFSLDVFFFFYGCRLQSFELTFFVFSFLPPQHLQQVSPLFAFSLRMYYCFMEGDTISRTLFDVQISISCMMGLIVKRTSSKKCISTTKVLLVYFLLKNCCCRCPINTLGLSPCASKGPPLQVSEMEQTASTHQPCC